MEMINGMSKRRQADLSMLAISFIWGSTFVLVKNALDDIGPFMFIGIRFILAFLILSLASYNNMATMRVSAIKPGIIIGAFLFIGYAFQTVGLQYTSPSNAGFITGLSVVLVPIIYAILKRTWPPLNTWITVALAAVGMYLLSIPAGTFHLAYGDLLVFFCAIGFALHIVAVDHFAHRHNAVVISGIQILFVGMVSTSIGLAIEPMPAYINTDLVSAIIITSVLATALAFLVQNYMQKFSTATRFAIVLATEPVFAAITSYFWAGDRLTERAIFGGGLIIAAMLLSILFRQPAEETAGEVTHGWEEGC